jgi:hypothetical protein
MSSASLLIPAVTRNNTSRDHRRGLSTATNDILSAMKQVQEEDNVSNWDDESNAKQQQQQPPLSPTSWEEPPPRSTTNHSFTCLKSNSVVGEMPTFRPRNYISQLIVEMEEALLGLNAKHLTLHKLESMAVLIYESMSISTRNYHSVQHIFDLISQGLEQNHIAILATCFHDCIYYHVDGGLTKVQADLLEGSFQSSCSRETEPKSERLHPTRYEFVATTTETSARHTRLLPMVETIFGYTPGQPITITSDGLNEFLSAVMAVRQLQEHLPMEQLAQIACCIQATIPFRKPDPNTGKTHMELLYDNMIATRDKFKLHLSDEDCVASVQRACLVSNSDVGNFGTTDRHWFLDNTWSLLPETNESLRDEYVYSVQQFHKALVKMYGFFGFLQPEVVFHEFRGVPSREEIDRLTGECRNNLKFGKTYVGAKLLAMSLVAALALLSGGDEAPLSLFTGDLRPDEKRESVAAALARGNSSSASLSSSTGSNGHGTSFMMHSREMPMPSEEDLSKCTALVYQILAVGRRSETTFDIKRSPWAAHLYGSMGDEELNRVLTEQTLYPMTEERAWSLLRALPRHSVVSISEDMCDNALSRAQLIRQVMAQL